MNNSRLVVFKQRVDSAIEKGTGIQERCIRCARTCMRLGGFVAHSSAEIAKRIDAFIFILEHEPVRWSVEITYSDEVKRTGSYRIDEKAIILADPLPEGVAVVVDYIWIPK